MEYVLLLSEESQSIMKRWVNQFYDFLDYNYVKLVESYVGDRLFGSTLAVFNGYDERIENMSVNAIKMLNIKNGDDWKELSVAMNDENLFMT